MQSASDLNLSEYDILPKDSKDAGYGDNYHPDFSSPEGDMILASKDCRVMFRTHSFILKTTSGFFRSMFSLPKSPPRKAEEVIYLNDDEKVLEYLLRMVSGMPFPPLDSLDTAEQLLHAAEGYEMPGPLHIIRLSITSPPLSEKDPFRMYAICSRYGWEEEGKVYTMRTLAYNIHEGEHRRSLERLSTSALLKLMAVHRTRRETLRQRLDDPPFVSGKPAVCVQCTGLIEYHTWRELKYKIILEMDNRPLGDTIYQGLLEWPEAKACWRASCPTPGCQRLLYDKPETLRVIRECIDNLSLTI
ncbi:hypothetical protein D9611_000087 [Ephemerocybe angulata]|uniref:BTB domain-containing protein n=1 Tax=Ephemerocybe angulata TaxID=980116 RepID=A0A8H5F810_9AGAR|nr:hypothetical protein D9611_000087 [Tulosesus angulatus]